MHKNSLYNIHGAAYLCRQAISVLHEHYATTATLDQLNQSFGPVRDEFGRCDAISLQLTTCGLTGQLRITADAQC